MCTTLLVVCTMSQTVSHNPFFFFLASFDFWEKKTMYNFAYYTCSVVDVFVIWVYYLVLYKLLPLI